ncbi:BrnT family toxin [Thermodesulfobacteriota bacterium]
MEFEWDRLKSISNRKKHNVDFADAVEVFYDPLALTIPDEGPDEARFVTMGTDALGLLLVVFYTWREERIRIISARKATQRERRQYEE